MRTSPINSYTDAGVLSPAQALHHLQDHFGRRRDTCAARRLHENLQQARVQRYCPGPCRGQVYDFCPVSYAARVRALQDRYGQIGHLAVFCCSLTGSQSHPVLTSNFSESNSSIRIPPSSPPALGDRFFGDVNEFAAFGVQKAPCRDEKPEQDVAATQGDNAADEPAAHRNSVSPSGSSGGEDLVPLRKFRLVKVPDCRFVLRPRLPSSIARAHSCVIAATRPWQPTSLTSTPPSSTFSHLRLSFSPRKNNSAARPSPMSPDGLTVKRNGTYIRPYRMPCTVSPTAIWSQPSRRVRKDGFFRTSRWRRYAMHTTSLRF